MSHSPKEVGIPRAPKPTGWNTKREVYDVMEGPRIVTIPTFGKKMQLIPGLGLGMGMAPRGK